MKYKRSYWPYYLAAVTCALFLLVLSNVRVDGALQTTDQAIYRHLQLIRTPQLDAILITITQMGDTFMVTAIASVVAFCLLLRKCWRTAIYWSLTLVSAAVLNTAIKGSIVRVRPGDMMYSGWTTYSFPSGHTTGNLVLYGLTCILLYRSLRGWPRIATIVGAIGFALLVAFSRLYLGAHWFSDVLGGALVATGILCIAGARYHAGTIHPLSPAQILVPIVATMVIAGSWHVYHDRHIDRERYIPRTGFHATVRHDHDISMQLSVPQSPAPDVILGLPGTAGIAAEMRRRNRS